MSGLSRKPSQGSQTPIDPSSPQGMSANIRKAIARKPHAWQRAKEMSDPRGECLLPDGIYYCRIEGGRTSEQVDKKTRELFTVINYSLKFLALADESLSAYVVGTNGNNIRVDGTTRIMFFNLQETDWRTYEEAWAELRFFIDTILDGSLIAESDEDFDPNVHLMRIDQAVPYLVLAHFYVVVEVKHKDKYCNLKCLAIMPTDGDNNLLPALSQSLGYELPPVTELEAATKLGLTKVIEIITGGETEPEMIADVPFVQEPESSAVEPEVVPGPEPEPSVVEPGVAVPHDADIEVDDIEIDDDPAPMLELLDELTRDELKELIKSHEPEFVFKKSHTARFLAKHLVNSFPEKYRIVNEVLLSNEPPVR